MTRSLFAQYAYNLFSSGFGSSLRQEKGPGRQTSRPIKEKRSGSLSRIGLCALERAIGHPDHGVVEHLIAAEPHADLRERFRRDRLIFRLAAVDLRFHCIAHADQ